MITHSTWLIVSFKNDDLLFLPFIKLTIRSLTIMYNGLNLIDIKSKIHFWKWLLYYNYIGT